MFLAVWSRAECCCQKPALGVVYGKLIICSSRGRGVKSEREEQAPSLGTGFKPVQFDLIEERSEPAVCGLDVGVEEGHRVASGRISTAQSRSHQTKSLRIAEYLDGNRKRLAELVERSMQVVAIDAHVVDEDDFLEIANGRFADNADETTKQGRVAFIVVDDDDARSWQVERVLAGLAPVEESNRKQSEHVPAGQ